MYAAVGVRLVLRYAQIAEREFPRRFTTVSVPERLCCGVLSAFSR
jgi:hypothetical protein